MNKIKVEDVKMLIKVFKVYFPMGNVFEDISTVDFLDKLSERSNFF